MISKQSILKIYQKYNVRAIKRLGQNFLHDHQIIQKIIRYANVENKDVIEIGPGLGSLTHALLEQAKSVTAYEIDPDMIRILQKEIKNHAFYLIPQNFLNADFNWKGKKVVVANIPYNITAPIFFKIFTNINKFASATIMVQKEVGERLLAAPSTKQYGKLSVTSQLLASVFKIIDVPATAFIPEPKVQSLVVKLDFKSDNFDPKLIHFIKICFSQQRKKLINNLATTIDKITMKKVLQKCQLKENIRPQEIPPLLFREMYNLIYN